MSDQTPRSPSPFPFPSRSPAPLADPEARARAASNAVDHLREARAQLMLAGAGREAVDRVRRALKSADGVERHAWLRADRARLAAEAAAPRVAALITGVGPRSTVPDDPAAVDADVYVDGVKVGACTLRPDHHGDLSPWGQAEHWADHGLLEWLGDDLGHQALVVAAVRRAMA